MESETGPLREATWTLIIVFFFCLSIPTLTISMTWLGNHVAPNNVTGLPVTIWTQPSCAYAVSSSTAGVSSSGVGGATPVSSIFASSCASFAVIASNDTKSTADSFPLLTKLQKIYPLSQYATHVLPASLREPPADPVQMANYVAQHLRPAVMALDGLVGPLVKRHFSLIHLPSTSALLLDAWIRGLFQYADALGHQQTVTFFEGKTLAQRYPGQRFSVSDVILSRLVEGTSNGAILRFGDVVSAFDPALLLDKFQTLGLGGPGRNSAVLVVNQQGDLGSTESYARLVAALHGFPVQSVNIAYTGTTAKGTFAPSQVQTAVNAIRATLADMLLAGGSVPARLIVVLNPGNYHAAQEAFATAFDPAFTTYNNDQRVVFLGLSFAPKATTPAVHFPVVRGVESVNIGPNDELTALGFASDATTLYSEVKQDLYVLDAAKFAARCRTMATAGGELGLTGKPLKFDASTSTVVATLTHDDGTIAAGRVMPSAGVETGLSYNGRISGRPTVPSK